MPAGAARVGDGAFADCYTLTNGVFTGGVSGEGGHLRSIHPYNIQLTLHDGSTLSGTSPLNSVTVKTSNSEWIIPMKHLKAVTRHDDGVMTSVELANGDSLTGTMALIPVELMWLYGNLTIDDDLIRAIHIAR